MSLPNNVQDHWAGGAARVIVEQPRILNRSDGRGKSQNLARSSASPGSQPYEATLISENMKQVDHVAKPTTRATGIAMRLFNGGKRFHGGRHRRRDDETGITGNRRNAVAKPMGDFIDTFR